MGRSRRRLSSPRQPWFERLIHEAAADPTLQDATRRVRAGVEQHVQKGTLQAQEVAQTIIDGAWTSFTKRELRRLAEATAIPVPHPRGRTNAAFSTRKRDARGLVVGTGVDLLSDKPWDELGEFVAEQTLQRQTLDENLKVQRRALDLRRRCPDARTPADAADMLGLSLEIYLATGKEVRE